MLILDDNIQKIDNWHVEAHWTGTHTNLNDYQPEKFFFDKKFFLEPYFLLSFFPYQSLKWGKSFKLLMGFRQKNLASFTKKEKQSLHQLHGDDNDFNYYQWGLTINDKLIKGCTFLYSKQAEMNPISSSFSENKIYFAADFRVKKNFLLPWKCLNRNQNNFLKFWWLPISNNKKAWSLTDANKIVINFYFPQTKIANFNLIKNKVEKSYFPYLYFINTELKKLPQIFSFAGSEINFFSQLKPVYFSPQPFQSLWYFTYLPFVLEKTNTLLVLDYFSWQFFQLEIKKWQNDNNFPHFISSQTVLEHLASKKMIWLAKINQQKKILLQTSLNHHSFSSSNKPEKEVSYFFYQYFHSFVTKSQWDWQQEKLVLAPPTFFTSFFTDPQTITNKITFFTSLIWNNLYSLKIFLHQTITFDNFAFWKKPQLLISQPKTKKNLTSSIQLILLLEKWQKTLLLEKWNFNYYLKWKKTWQKDLISKKL